MIGSNSALLVSISLVLAFCNAHADLRPQKVEAPRRGVFLVANKAMQDRNFAESVVLLTDHSLRGSIGLVVNRTSHRGVVDSLPQLRGLSAASSKLRWGGPLEPHSVRVLVKSPKPLVGTTALLDHVHFLNSIRRLHELLGAEDSPKPVDIQYYAGYAAWSPGQLEFEIARGDWYLVRLNAKTLFEHSDRKLWSELIEMLEATWVLRENEATDSRRTVIGVTDRRFPNGG